jgi:hypothetical protein
MTSLYGIRVTPPRQVILTAGLPSLIFGVLSAG